MEDRRGGLVVGVVDWKCYQGVWLWILPWLGADGDPLWGFGNVDGSLVLSEVLEVRLAYGCGYSRTVYEVLVSRGEAELPCCIMEKLLLLTWYL